jgi:hypothetical protein
MKHPNEGFIRSFLGKDKAYKEQLLAEQKKQRVNEYFANKKNKQNILTEQNKKYITRTLDVIYPNVKKSTLLEQKNTQDWQPVQTQYGIFYYNEKTKEWMNTFGVIKKSLGEFIQLIDYSTNESDIEYKRLPRSPSEFEASLVDSLGTVLFEWVDNSSNENGYVLYITQVQ